MKNQILLSAIFIISFGCNAPTEAPAEAGPTNVEIVNSIYSSFAAGDVESVLATFDQGIVWNEAENFIYADGNPYVGPDAVVQGVFARLGGEWDYWNLENIELNSLGDDGVLSTGRYKAKNKSNGKELDAQFAHVWKFSNGKVKSFQQYTDTWQAKEVVSAEPLHVQE